MRVDPKKRAPSMADRAPENAKDMTSARQVYAAPELANTSFPRTPDEIAARHRLALSAFRLSVGVMKADAERLTWIAYEIGKYAEIAGLQSLSDQAAQIALRAFDVSEAMG